MINIEYKEKLDDELYKLLDDEFNKFAIQNEVSCNYTPFNFIAKEENQVVGVLTGHSYYKEVHIGDLIILKEYRNKHIGSKLMKSVEDYFKDKDFENINLTTYQFQAPEFYKKCGFEVEFIRKNKENPKLTKLSTNSYSTDKVALIKDEEKVTLQAKIPDKIILDNDLLSLSRQENIYGLADVFSIYTALYNWKIAQNDINETINVEIYNMANKLLEDTLKFVNNNKLEDIIKCNVKLFEFIGIAGYITNLYGTGRPESGSEHIMAKEIESVVDVPHGISVSIGILLMTLLQGRDIQGVLSAIKKLNILQNCAEYGITKEIIKECFLKLKPRLDRYTIINRYEGNNEIREETIKKFFEVIKG